MQRRAPKARKQAILNCRSERLQSLVLGLPRARTQHMPTQGSSGQLGTCEKQIFLGGGEAGRLGTCEKKNI